MNTPNRFPSPENYELRVRCLEALGADTSDAQGVADAQDLHPTRELDVELRTLMEKVAIADTQSDGGYADATSVLKLMQAIQADVQRAGAAVPDDFGLTYSESAQSRLLAMVHAGVAQASRDTYNEYKCGDPRNGAPELAGESTDDELAEFARKANITPYLIAAQAAKTRDELKARIVADALDVAINAATETIQMALGVQNGDLAGDWFSDNSVCADLRATLSDYFDAEVRRIL